MGKKFLSQLSWVMGIFAFCTCASQADFIQGQIPEFTLGAVDWSEQQIFQADGVAVDPVSGKVFFSDATSHRVLRFSASVSTSPLAVNPAEAEAVLGQDSLYGTGARSSAYGLNNPTGLAFDPAGNLYVVDSGNHRVVRFSGAGTAASGAMCDWVLGQASFTGNAQGSGTAAFRDPQGVAILGGYLAVADTGNHRVQVFHDFQTLTSGASVSVSYGTGSAGRSATAFNQPRSVAISTDSRITSSDLRLWVADTGNNRVLRFDQLNGTSLVDGINYNKQADGVLGQVDFTTDNRGSMPTASNLSALSLLVVGQRLFVGDSIFKRILRYDNAAAKGNGAVADGVLGQTSLFSEEPAVTGNALSWTGSAIWSTARSGGSRFDSTAGVAAAVPNSQLPAAPATATGNNVVMMAEDRLLHKCYVYEPASGRLIRRYASCAAFRAGKPPEFIFGVSLSPTVQVGLTLGGLAAHGGQLTLSDTTKNRVIHISNAAFVTPSIPAQVVIIGQPSASSMNAGLNDAGLTRMNFPTALCWASGPDHSALRLYVADTGNHRVLSYTPALPSIAEIFGGVDGVSGTTSGRLSSPRGLAYDANSGLLHVADTGNNRLLQFRAFTTASTTAVTPGNAVGVLGQPSFTTATTGSGVDQLSGPTSLTLTPSPVNSQNSSEIFVLDQGNRRVALFYYNNVIAPVPPLLIRLTFNTTSTTSTEVYPYPSIRELGIGGSGALMQEMSDRGEPRSLWITAGQRVSWFQRDFTPVVRIDSSPADVFKLTFTSRPFYSHEISASADLQASSWNVVSLEYGADNKLQTYEEARMSRPRQFYRVREIQISD